MMLLYAVIPAQAGTPRLVGLSGNELETVSSADAAMVVEECDRQPDTSKAEAMQFARILEELAGWTTLLPVRFPSAADSRSEVRAELDRRGHEWQRRLDQLEGVVELVVRASWSGHPAPTRGDLPSGGRYLRERAAALHADEALAIELEEVAAPWCRETQRLSARRGVRLACLARRDVTSKLRAALDTWQGQATCREVLVSGPWPPFSFVSEPDG
ncbi:MAG: GvpL/GvpF family gas vesicle protein [Nocardioidaceae bacterium]